MSENPYAPSEFEANTPTSVKSARELAAAKRRLDQQCGALAGFWVLFGLFLIWVGEFGRQNLPTQIPNDWNSLFEASIVVSCLLMGAVGIAWVVLGILTAFRIEQAIRIALATTYALLLLPAVWITIFGLLILPIAIAQAHRVLSSLEDLRNAKLAREQELARDAVDSLGLGVGRSERDEA